MFAMMKVLARPDIIPRALAGDPVTITLLAISGISFAAEKSKKR